MVVSKPDARDQQIHLRVSAAELRMARAVARRRGLNLSDLVRQWVRTEYEGRGLDGPIPAPRGAGTGALPVVARRLP